MSAVDVTSRSLSPRGIAGACCNAKTQTAACECGERVSILSVCQHVRQNVHPMILTYRLPHKDMKDLQAQAH
eukprot:15755-Eustigmatos_ZCMA.PRE.1